MEILGLQEVIELLKEYNTKEQNECLMYKQKFQEMEKLLESNNQNY